jgi:hypothetical protein
MSASDHFRAVATGNGNLIRDKSGERFVPIEGSSPGATARSARDCPSIPERTPLASARLFIYPPAQCPSSFDSYSLRMSPYRVIVTDRVLPALAGNAGVSYASAPQQRDEALALVRALLGLAQLRDEQGPWRHARPGGQRTVRLEQTS